MSVCVSVYLSVCMSIYPSISTHLPTSTYLPTYLPTYQSMNQWINLSMLLSAWSFTICPSFLQRDVVESFRFHPTLIVLFLKQIEFYYKF